jgi:hypothetical protein
MKKQPPPRFIFRDNEGNIFAEYTLETMKSDTAPFPKDIRKRFTKCAIEGARVVGLEAKESDLEKYGLIT